MNTWEASAMSRDRELAMTRDLTLVRVSTSAPRPPKKVCPAVSSPKNCPRRLGRRKRPSHLYGVAFLELFKRRPAAARPRCSFLLLAPPQAPRQHRQQHPQQHPSSPTNAAFVSIPSVTHFLFYLFLPSPISPSK